MGLDPTLREQERMAEALQRHAETLTAAERRAEAVVSGGLVLAALALIVAAPPAALAHPLAAAGCLIALVVALRAEFDTGSGFTVPSQLAFVPLLFALPPSLAPVAVVAALMIAYLPTCCEARCAPCACCGCLAARGSPSGPRWSSLRPRAGPRQRRRRWCSSPRSRPSSPATSAPRPSWSGCCTAPGCASSSGRPGSMPSTSASRPSGWSSACT